MLCRLLFSAAALLLTASSAQGLAPRSVRLQHLEADSHADLVINTPTPHFSWQLENEGPDVRGVTQTAYRITVQPAVAIAADRHVTRDSGKVACSRSTLVSHVGEPLLPSTSYVASIQYWSSTGAVSDTVDIPFRTAMWDVNDGPGSWIGSTQIPMGEVRKVFSVTNAGNIASATLEMSGIGYSELWLNGAIVDPSRRLDPGWTTFEKRVLYTSFDVSKLLVTGQNCIGVKMGNGWYSQEQYVSGVDEPSYGPPRLNLMLTVNYSDGSSLQVPSDTTWTGRTGALLHDGVYMGSFYDARLNRDGWALANFTDPLSAWIPAEVLPTPLDSTGLFSLQTHDPIRVPPNNLHFKTSPSNPPGVVGQDLVATNGGVFHPTSIGGVSEGQLFDLGQNMAGWCQIKATGRPGLSIMIKYSETLALPNQQTAHGLYTENLRNAASTDIYVFKTDKEEIIEPQFTVHGFRYIEIRGAKNGIAASDITCYFVHSETTAIGNFNTSNTVMNQIQHNILWGQLSNLMSLPTDCAQRDERKGWMGDSGLTVDEALYNFDLAPFYNNFLNLIQDDQSPSGGVSDTVPHTFGNNPADPNWGTAFPQIAWYLYDHYGDLTILSTFYAPIKAWVENVRAGWEKTGLKNIAFEYGDWVPPPPYPQSDQHLISSFPFLRDVLRLSTMAGLLNNTVDQKAYATLYAQLVSEFNSNWFTSNSVGYAQGMQTSNALALALPGLVPSASQAAVVAALVADVKSKGHLTTGIVGAAQLFPVLSANNEHDTALMLAQSVTYPSYGWTFTNSLENATTMWELWDDPNEGPGMNSRNHIMFGSVGAWFYRYVAGIELNALQVIGIHPRMALDASLLENVAAEVHSIKGVVAVTYERDAQKEKNGVYQVKINVIVPNNAEADVKFERLLVGGRVQTLVESGKEIYNVNSAASQLYSKPSAVVDGVKSVSIDSESGLATVRVASGSYSFVATWA